jgi:hypothetical protein
MADEQNLANLLLDENDNPSATATLDPVDEASATAETEAGPRCEKCEAPIHSDKVSICPHCGWYASLGTFVEVDPSWEGELLTPPNDNTSPTPAMPSWRRLLPRWSWVIIASVLSILVESVIVRLVTPEGSTLRTAWSLVQLTAGFLTFFVCHIVNFIFLAAEDADFGLLDMLLKPVKLWSRTVRDLPYRLWLVNSAACGAAATLLSVLVIGGIPYERLWDWGFDPPPKKSLVGAVIDRAKELESQDNSDNLEDAIRDFAGSDDAEAQDANKLSEKPRGRADCVILGFQLDQEHGRLTALLLGTAHAGRLIFVGQVEPNLPDEERQQLLQKLQSIKSDRPFIPLQEEAIWVKPNLACRVSFGERLRNGRFHDLRWDTMLGPLRTR